MIVGMNESMIDYPNKMCVIVFTKTCKWNCKNCHNQKTLPFSKEIPMSAVLDFIRSDYPLIQAVTISGGEPTEWSGLREFILKLKSMGLSVKLDTNGSNYKVLTEVLPLVDAVAMDIKTDINDATHYQYITNCSMDDYHNVLKSVEYLSRWHSTDPSNHILIYRTTLLDPSINSEQALESMSNYACTEHIIQSDII